MAQDADISEMSVKEFKERVGLYRARQHRLALVVARDGRLRAVSRLNPSNTQLLCRDMSGESVWRVTSFVNGQPVGHRAYDQLTGGMPCQNALAEFASDAWEVQS